MMDVTSSTTATAFSSDGAEVMSRKIEPRSVVAADLQGESERDISKYYDMEKVSTFIATNNFKKVALQFPDLLLPDAYRITTQLQKEFQGKEFFILGDTSYGSCCVDEVAAEHVTADCIIHFGPACLTQTKRLPVLYIFGAEDIDAGHCVETFKSLFPLRDALILVLYDTVYSHCIDEFKGQISQDYPNCVVSSLLLPRPVPPKSHDLSETGHIQSSTEKVTRSLCCSSCGKTGAGSCSSKVSGNKDTSRTGEGKEEREKAESSGSDVGKESSLTDDKEGQMRTESVGVKAKDDGASRVQSSGEVKTDLDQSDRSTHTSVPDETSGKSNDHIGTATDGDGHLQELLSGETVAMEKQSHGNTGSEVGGVLRGAGNDTDTVTSAQQLHNYERFGRSFVLSSPIDHYSVFYIGTEGPTLNNLILNYNKSQFYSYNPISKESRKETVNVNKALGRRYFLVQKAKEAKTVGILIGTLGAGGYLDVIERLKQIIRDAGKKYYTVAVGKLNVPKMANFLEIDVYVLVACPENSLIESREFFKPVITPFELELACVRSREWSGDYTTSFQDLLPGGKFHVPTDIQRNKEVDDEPEYSLITGGFVPSQQTSGRTTGDVTSSAVVQRSKMEVALEGSAGAQFLQSRSWRGLEQKLGETEVTDAVEGRTGLPVSYSHEHEHES